MTFHNCEACCRLSDDSKMSPRETPFRIHRVDFFLERNDFSSRRQRRLPPVQQEILMGSR